MDELSVARWTLQAVDAAAGRTQAIRRAQVVSVSGTGVATVLYKGKEIAIDNGSGRVLVGGEWVELTFAHGQLTLSGRSSYGH